MPKLRQPSRDAITKRLARSAGHLQATLRLIARQRPAYEIAQQLAAVEAAVAAAKRQLVTEQVQLTLGEAEADGGAVRQLQALARFL